MFSRFCCQYSLINYLDTDENDGIIDTNIEFKTEYPNEFEPTKVNSCKQSIIFMTAYVYKTTINIQILFKLLVVAVSIKIYEFTNLITTLFSYFLFFLIR